jgi:SAM-dependent methyltransferase
MNMHAPPAPEQTPAKAGRSICRLCGAALRHTFVDLGMSPLCESLIAAADLDAMEPFFPLHAMVCSECWLVQLNEYVSPAHIFTEYAYYSSYSTTWVAHAKAYCAAITRRMPLGQDSLVVEVASNDGYLLQHFLPLGIPVLGIEPAANVAKVAVEKGVQTRVDFFGQRLAAELVSNGLRADLIIGNNVLAQVPELNDFVAGMGRLLKPEGLITLEFPHLERLIEQSQFDTIYHEHFSYFSLLAVERLAARHDLKVIDVEELPTHGGSLRVYLAHASSAWMATLNVADLLARERRLRFESLSTYAAFEEQVRHTKRRLLSFLIAAKDRGKRICGYGAPGKGNTLLNYCGIGPDFLDFTVDRNPYKHGHYTAGMHIPIHPVEAIYQARPDYILILPWNLKAEIVSQMRDVAEWGAKFVVPIPEATVIDPKELS